MWLTQCVYFLGLLKLHTKHWLPTIGTQRQRWSFGFTHSSEVKDLWHTGSWSIFRWKTGHNQCKLLLVKSINKKILFWRQKVGLFHVACSYYDILMTNTFCPVSCFQSNENFSLCSNTPFLPSHTPVQCAEPWQERSDNARPQWRASSHLSLNHAPDAITTSTSCQRLLFPAPSSSVNPPSIGFSF